jgi:hypothetical protein
VRALQQTFVLEVIDVLVNGGERAQFEAAGDLFIGRGVAVALYEAADEIQHFFLPAGDGHGRESSE